MQWFKTWQIGMKSLLLHPMRSGLTVLGILIGVASVIWLLAISSGISQKAQEQIEGLGADNIIIRSIQPSDTASVGFSAPKPFGVTRAEFKQLRDSIPTLTSALQIRELNYKVAYPGNPAQNPIEARLVGCTPEYAEVTRLEIDRGHFITEQEVSSASPHCVLAAQLVDKLFPYEDPIGREVYFPELRQYYEVVGVMKHREATAAIGGSLAAQEFGRDVYIPIDTMRQRFGDMVVKRGQGSFNVKIFELSQVTLRVDGVDNVYRTNDLVRETLIPNPEKNPREDLSIIVPKELLDQARATRVMFMVFMGLMAAISLLVGGIGIMNIMLATVTERTREIGIRRALGAKRSDIVRQFLVETLGLAVIGGLSGVLLGLLCPAMIEGARNVVQELFPKLWEDMPDMARDVEPQIVPASIPIAFFISVVVGVVFGIYPAIRAAGMDPIEALRHE